MADWLKTEGLTARQIVDLPPVWLMGCIVLVWLQVWLWPAATWDIAGMSALGAALFWGGLALMGWAILSFRAFATSVVPHQTPRRIISTGPFAFSRNPIYLGDLMVLVGVIAGQGAYLMLWSVPFLAVILVRRFIAPEELRMKENFGVEYEVYAQKTRRWL